MGSDYTDYTEEATALFTRFAERNSLIYEVDYDAPVEVLWTFPAQGKLLYPVILGLSNGDELNFGVSDFWSYFFPFKKAADQFEQIINAWVAGGARVVVTGPWGRLLQLRDQTKWQTVYAANRILPFFGTPRQIVDNRSLPDRIE